jgi:predicted dehydrogenase
MITPASPSVALLGLGFAGATLHLPALRRLPVRIVMAVDPDTSTHSRAWDVPTRRDWHDAIDSSAQAVIVATPAESHAELALAALARGKHVYVEKPMATTAEEAAAICTAATSARRIVQVGFAYRFHPLWRRLHRLLRAGSLHPPLRLDARFTTTRGGSGWRDPVLDLAPHHIDLASWLLGAAPTDVRARGEEIEARWEQGSRLTGSYALGPPVDRVCVRAGRRTIIIDRLAGWRLHGNAPLRARLPPVALVRTRISRRDWERSFEWALASFLDAANGRVNAAAGSVGADRPGPEAGMLGVEVTQAIIRSKASQCPERTARR